MFEQRKNIRYQTLAKVRIEGADEGESLLKDLSVTGCCVESTSYSQIKSNVHYKLEVIPESAANIGTFGLVVESKWIRNEGYSCEIGFTITESPKGRQFERYVDYLSWRYAQGNSMTGSGPRETPSEA